MIFLNVLITSTYSKYFELRLHAIEKGIRYKLEVKIKPEFDARHFKGKISIYSNHPDLHHKDISIMGWAT